MTNDFVKINREDYDHLLFAKENAKLEAERALKSKKDSLDYNMEIFENNKKIYESDRKNFLEEKEKFEEGLVFYKKEELVVFGTPSGKYIEYFTSKDDAITKACYEFKEKIKAYNQKSAFYRFFHKI